MTHPFRDFAFCPKCGADHFVENNEKSKKCIDCGFIYYFNPSTAVVAIIENNEGNVLVARRAKDPAKGTLDLPGGFVDLFETPEEAMQREVMEETGLSVISPRYLFSIPNIYLYSGFEVHTVDLFFQCKIDDFSGLKAQDDVSELLFIEKKKLEPTQFGLISIQKAINKLVSENENSITL